MNNNIPHQQRYHYLFITKYSLPLETLHSAIRNTDLKVIAWRAVFFQNSEVVALFTIDCMCSTDLLFGMHLQSTVH